jgi:hypothetical protein
VPPKKEKNTKQKNKTGVPTQDPPKKMIPGLKHACMVLLVLAVVSFVASMADRRKTRIPRSVKDRVRTAIRTVSQNALAIHATMNQNAIVSLLRLTADDAVLDNLRATFCDADLTEITKIDVATLSEAIKTEQHKAFQRVAYFLPAQLGHDAFLQYYFPQSVYNPRPGAGRLAAGGSGGVLAGSSSVGLGAAGSGSGGGMGPNPGPGNHAADSPATQQPVTTPATRT